MWRWPIQAVDLLRRDPLTMALLVGAFGSLGVVFWAIIEAVGASGAIWASFVTRAMAAGLLVAALCVIMRIDGYGPDLSPSNRRNLFGYCFIAGSLGAVFMARALSIENDGSESVPGLLELVSWQASMAASEAMMGTFIVFTLWPVLMINFGIGAMQAVRQSGVMMMKEPNVWFSMALITLLIATITPRLPDFWGVPLYLFWTAWIYVAAREMFGGIRTNKPYTQPQMQGA